LTWSRCRVAIETQSELTRGMTVVDKLGVSRDAINADLWSAAAGESPGADILWTLDSAKFKTMLTAALAAYFKGRADGRGPQPSRRRDLALSHAAR
jgi:inosine-uridine nucleoside N-ribohydrolase